MLNVYIKSIEDILPDFEMSKYRQEKYDNLKTEEAKAQCKTVSFLINKHLQTLGLSEKSMEYECKENGKPYFKNHQEIFFNISHSKKMVMVAFSEKEVGCDIQLIKDINKAIYRKTLSSEEKVFVESANDIEEEKKRFFTLWAIKEAKIKASGVGIACDLTKVDREGAYATIKNFSGESYAIAVYNGDNIDNLNVL